MCAFVREHALHEMTAEQCVDVLAGFAQALPCTADVPWKEYPPSTLTLPSTLDVP